MMLCITFRCWTLKFQYNVYLSIWFQVDLKFIKKQKYKWIFSSEQQTGLMYMAHSNKIYKSDSSAAILASILNIRIFSIPTFWDLFAYNSKHSSSRKPQKIQYALTYPKIVRFLLDFLKRDRTIRNKVVWGNGSIVENCQSDCAPVVHLSHKILVPHRSQSFRFSGGSSYFIVVNIYRYIWIYQQSPLGYLMASGAVSWLQIMRFADL